MAEAPPVKRPEICVSELIAILAVYPPKTRILISSKQPGVMPLQVVEGLTTSTGIFPPTVILSPAELEDFSPSIQPPGSANDPTAS